MDKDEERNRKLNRLGNELVRLTQVWLESCAAKVPPVALSPEQRQKCDQLMANIQKIRDEINQLGTD